MITWPNLIGLVAVVAVVVLAVYLLGWVRRRDARMQAASKARAAERADNFKSLESWLLDKTTRDLAESNSETTPYIKAFIQIIQMSGTVDELRPIAEVYRYRKGFKNEWIGE